MRTDSVWRGVRIESYILYVSTWQEKKALRLKEGTTLALNYDTGYNTYPLTQPWSILSPIFWTALQACCWHDLTKENRREEKEHVFVSLTSMQGQELFPTVPNSSRVIWRPVVGRIPKCTPARLRPEIADGGLKTMALHSNSSCSQLWSILMCVSVNISTHLYMHMHIGPQSPPQKIGCHIAVTHPIEAKTFTCRAEGQSTLSEWRCLQFGLSPKQLFFLIGVGQH